jgi:outer membrane protein assembly factor BamB
MRNEIKLSAAALATASAKATAETGADAKTNQPVFQFLWKTTLDNQPAQLNALTQPLLLQNIISHKGFKALAFVGGSADVVYAIDYDLNRVYWKQRLSTAARIASPTATCPGGLTAVTRATPVVPQGLPGGRGAPPGPGGPVRGPGPGPAPTGQAPQNRGGINVNNLPINSAVYAVSSGGLLHFLNPHIGEDIQPPVKFLSPGAKVSGLIQVDNVLYAGTADNCGGTPNGVWAMDLASEKRPVTRWGSGATLAGTTGPAFGLDGTVFVATGSSNLGSASPKPGTAGASGGRQLSHSVVALEAKTLKQRDSFTATTPFVTSPMVFSLKDRDVVAAANSDGQIYLLDAKTIGGADHATPLARSPKFSVLPGSSPQALATWEEPDGTRWLLTQTTTGLTAYKIVNEGGTLSFQQGWSSRPINSPAPPTILNDIVFVLDSGLLPDEGKTTTTADRIKRGKPAVLYALDGRTGKELWNSGQTMTSFSPGVAPSAGDSQVYVVTYDGTLYTFGLPQER